MAVVFCFLFEYDSKNIRDHVNVFSFVFEFTIRSVIGLYHKPFIKEVIMYQGRESVEVADEPVSARLQRVGAILVFAVFMTALIAPKTFENLFS